MMVLNVSIVSVAPRLHGVPGVDGEVENDHLDLVWIDQSGPEIRSKYRFELHRPAQGDAEQIAHSGDLAV